MKTTKTNSGIKVNASVKAGGLPVVPNHNGSGLKVKSAMKAGLLIAARNHSRRMLASA